MALDPTDIRSFYDRSHTHTGEAEDAFRRWRELGALTKADHICKLERIPPPRAVLEVGCGDGAVLAELSRRGVGEARTGIDISSAAIRLLVISTHVLEHVPAPFALLAEITRVSQAIVTEVGLERNVSARRASPVPSRGTPGICSGSIASASEG
jgi:2-polyprenyl-3-methyl-5-hydroxy-6-metoxy-1,4-benzoquinol methylase